MYTQAILGFVNATDQKVYVVVVCYDFITNFYKTYRIFFACISVGLCIIDFTADSKLLCPTLKSTLF